MIESIILLLTVLCEIAGALLFLYLMVYLLGVYTVVYRILPSGRREKVGYLWRIKGEYILYDTLLPLFESSRAGFINGYEVRPLVVNSQQNKVQKKLGTFDDNGKILDLNGNQIATCENANKRCSNIISTSGERIGSVRGSLRANKDLTIRGAGFSALYEKESGTQSVFDVRVGFRDLLLPAALIYMLLYAPLLLLVDSLGLGYSNVYMLVMLSLYLLLIGVLYVIKYEKTIRNDNINYLIGLVGRNVGVKGLNICTIVAAIICLRISGIQLLPLFAVTVFGFFMNLPCFAKTWHIEQPGSSWSGYIPTIPGQQPSANVSQTTRRFEWGRVLEIKGLKDNNEAVELSFVTADFHDSSSGVRRANPFRNGPIVSDEDLVQRARQVLDGAKTTDGSEDAAIAKILNSAYQLCLQYGLADFELFDLVLGFVQSNIEYKIDEESSSIDNVKEYFRYASETLYDAEGDCDCKSVLAYKLFEKLGVDVDLVTVQSGNKGVYNHVALVLKNNPRAAIQLPPEYAEFAPGRGVYCESTGEGFKPGDVPDDVNAETLIVIS